MIVFEGLSGGEKLRCRVVGFSVFGSFKDLLSAFDKRKFGHPESITLSEQLERMYVIYSKTEEIKNGVVGIHIALI